jgi:hypothetical protein
MKETGVNINQQIQGWIIEAFKLPKETAVDINERECMDEGHSSIDTVIAVYSCRDHTHEYNIPKPPADIRYEDIELLRNMDWHKHLTHKKSTILGHLFRFSIWWLSFSGLYAMFATCPCCGQVGCPVGAGSAGLVGGFLALCNQNWKRLIKFVYAKMFRRTESASDNKV